MTNIINYQSKLGISFNPTACYALWYVNGEDHVLSLIRAVALAGPFVGSILAGTICGMLTPDDPTSYERPKRYLTIPKMKTLNQQSKQFI